MPSRTNQVDDYIYVCPDTYNICTDWSHGQQPSLEAQYPQNQRAL